MKGPRITAAVAVVAMLAGSLTFVTGCPPTNTTTSTITSTPVPITVALDYFGIRNTHWISQIGGESNARIQLVAVVRDEQQNLKTLTIPPEDTSGFAMDFFQVHALKHNMSPVIFAGDAVGSVTVYVVAYNVGKGAITKAQIDLISAWTGLDWSVLKTFIPDKELVGSYWHTWAPSEWASGLNQQGGDSNLAVWLRIGRRQLPDPAQQPALYPDLKITGLTLPTDARVSLGPYVYTDYYTTFTLRNSESFDLTVQWQAHSSVTGNYDGGTGVVRGNSQQPVSGHYHYSETGSRTITVTVSYNGTQLDTKSGTMTVWA
ncbi:MAG: hypothetical protein NTU41_03900 [Chloroflexi bacterium]|nr:hypothetical protein [Chloroflexota bacterium]